MISTLSLSVVPHKYPVEPISVWVRRGSGPFHYSVSWKAFAGCYAAECLDACDGALPCIKIMTFLNDADFFLYHCLKKVSSENWFIFGLSDEFKYGKSLTCQCPTNSSLLTPVPCLHLADSKWLCVHKWSSHRPIHLICQESLPFHRPIKPEKSLLRYFLAQSWHFNLWVSGGCVSASLTPAMSLSS